MTTRTYRARVSDKAGRTLYETALEFTTREEAARMAFRMRPKAMTCSTCYGAGFDIRSHRRSDILA